MRFGAPEFLKGLLILLPLAALFIALHRQRAARLVRLIHAKIWPTVIPGHHPKRSRRQTVLRMLVFLCILLALARPQWGVYTEEVQQRGLDILVVLDTSKSMLATDIKPNRLQQAQWAVRDFVRHLKGDRIGLIAFAGSSFLQCPVTVDYAAFTMTLNDLYAGIIPQGGTAIAQALDLAINSFEKDSEADRVIILITDGEDHTGDSLRIAKKLKEKNIHLFSIGVGTADGELIPTANGYLKDQQGQVVKSALQETLLEKLTSGTGGFYVRSAPGDFGLDRIYQLGIAGLQRDEQQTRVIQVYQDRFGWFVAAGLLFLLIEGFSRRKKHSLPLILLTLFFLSPQADAKSWVKAYQKNEYTNALQGLEKQIETFPGIGNYNRGNTLYRMKKFEDSEKAYAEAIAQTQDSELKQKARYNRGTALLAGLTKKSGPEQLEDALADTAQAVDLFEQVCTLNPEHWAAKQNLERALHIQQLLEEQKKEQEQQQNEQNQSQEEGDEDSSEQEPSQEQSDEPAQDEEEEEKSDSSSSESQEQQEQQAGSSDPSSENGENAQSQPQQAGEMSEEEAQQLLDAMMQNEKDQRLQLRPSLGSPIRVEKDW